MNLIKESESTKKEEKLTEKFEEYFEYIQSGDNPKLKDLVGLNYYYLNFAKLYKSKK